MEGFVVYNAVELEGGEAGVAGEEEEADECAWGGVSLVGRWGSWALAVGSNVEAKEYSPAKGKRTRMMGRYQ